MIGDFESFLAKQMLCCDVDYRLFQHVDLHFNQVVGFWTAISRYLSLRLFSFLTQLSVMTLCRARSVQKDLFNTLLARQSAVWNVRMLVAFNWLEEWYQVSLNLFWQIICYVVMFLIDSFSKHMNLHFRHVVEFSGRIQSCKDDDTESSNATRCNTQLNRNNH